MLCSSNGRCSEWAELANQVCNFCEDVIEILSIEGDEGDVKSQMK